MNQFKCRDMVVFHYTPDSHNPYGCLDYIIIMSIIIITISTIKGMLCSFGEEVQTQNEEIIQTQNY